MHTETHVQHECPRGRHVHVHNLHSHRHNTHSDVRICRHKITHIYTHTIIVGCTDPETQVHIHIYGLHSRVVCMYTNYTTYSDSDTQPYTYSHVGRVAQRVRHTDVHGFKTAQPIRLIQAQRQTLRYLHTNTHTHTYVSQALAPNRLKVCRREGTQR